MPERWLAQLDKLESLEPSADVLERARQGYRRPSPTPPSRGRLAAALVALLIAIAGGSGAFWAFRDRGPEPTAPPAVFHALWPEQDLTGAQDAQAKVDARDPTYAWRTDPARVAARFSKHVLGWARAIVTDQTNVDGNVVIDLISVPGPCEFPGCPAGEHRVTLTMARLLEQGEEGIWSVVGVDSGALLTLPLEVGQEITLSHAMVTVSTTLPEGTHVGVGWTIQFGCGNSGSMGGTTSVHQGSFKIVVESTTFGNGCGDDIQPSTYPLSGYVWAYTSDAPAPQNDPFEGSLDSLPSVGYVLELAAVPVTFLPVPDVSQSPK